MKDLKFTPSPWIVEQLADDGHCAVVQLSNKSSLSIDWCVSNEEENANAKLIAAAPDLLEALESHELKMCMFDWATLPKNSDGYIAYAKIKEAIEKATT